MTLMVELLVGSLDEFGVTGISLTDVNAIVEQNSVVGGQCGRVIRCLH